MKQLFDELKPQAGSFRVQNDFENYANTLHNMAFIRQASGQLDIENSKDADQPDGKRAHLTKAIKNYAEAEENYLEAKKYRLRLRDPRRTAQSNVRIIACTLARIQAYIAYLARDDIQARGDYPQKLESLVSSVFGKANSPRNFIELIKEVCKIYEEQPQEDLRLNDVDAVVTTVKNMQTSSNPYLQVINNDPFTTLFSEVKKQVEALMRVASDRKALP